MHALRLVGLAILTAIAPIAVLIGSSPAHADTDIGQPCSPEGAKLWGTPARYIASARRTGNCNGYQFLLGHCVWRSATGLAGHRGPPADPHGPPAC